MPYAPSQIDISLLPDHPEDQDILNALTRASRMPQKLWMGQSQGMEGYPVSQAGGFGVGNSIFDNFAVGSQDQFGPEPQMPTPMDAQADQMYASVQENPADHYMNIGRQMASEMANDYGPIDRAYELSVAARTGKNVGEVLNEQKARRINAMNALTAQVNSEIAYMNAMKEKQGTIPSSIQEALFAAGGDQQQAQALMRTGMEQKAPKPSAFDEKYQALRSIGKSHKEAVTALTNLYTFSAPDPMGNSTVVDKSTGQPVGQFRAKGAGVGGFSDEELEAADDETKRYIDENSVETEQDADSLAMPMSMEDKARAASGLFKTAREVVGRAAGSIGIDVLPPDEVTKYRNELNQFSRIARGALLGEGSRARLSNWEQQDIDALIPKGGSGDPARAAESMASLRSTLETLIQMRMSTAQNPNATPQAQAEAADAAIAIKQVLDLMGPRPTGAIDLSGKSDAEIDQWIEGKPSGTKFIINGEEFTVK